MGNSNSKKIKAENIQMNTELINEVDVIQIVQVIAKDQKIQNKILDPQFSFECMVWMEIKLNAKLTSWCMNVLWNDWIEKLSI